MTFYAFALNSRTLFRHFLKDYVSSSKTPIIITSFMCWNKGTNDLFDYIISIYYFNILKQVIFLL